MFGTDVKTLALTSFLRHFLLRSDASGWVFLKNITVNLNAISCILNSICDPFFSECGDCYIYGDPERSISPTHVCSLSVQLSSQYSSV